MVTAANVTNCFQLTVLAAFNVTITSSKQPFQSMTAVTARCWTRQPLSDASSVGHASYNREHRCSSCLRTGQVALPSGAAAGCRNACRDSRLPAGDTAAESLCGRSLSPGTRPGTLLRSEAASDSRFRARSGSWAQQASPGGHGDRSARRTAWAAGLDEAFRSGWNTLQSWWILYFPYTSIRNTLALSFRVPREPERTPHFLMTSSSPKHDAFRLLSSSCRRVTGGVVNHSRTN